VKDRISIVLIVEGNRGRGIFGQYALTHSQQVVFFAVVDPDEEKCLDFAQAHRISAVRQFASVAEFFERHPDKIADALIIAASGTVRAELVSLRIKAGYADLSCDEAACRLRSRRTHRERRAQRECEF